MKPALQTSYSKSSITHPKDSSTSSSNSDVSAYDYDTRSTTPELIIKTHRKSRVEPSPVNEAEAAPNGIGILPDDVYERAMGSWRAGIRKYTMRSLVWESNAIGAIQKRLRTPFLDAYFVNTSALGTHTFFMTMLPAFCFFGYQDVTRGLIFVLALGVYLSSFVKDFVCSPRPLSPPVARLSIGTHHLEYGFPSTHSTNSVSIALFFFTLLHRVYTAPASIYTPPIAPSDPLIQNATHVIQDVLPRMTVSSTTYYVCAGMLVFYMFSIVFGRLYTGMHSFTDCAFGVLLGAAIWGLYVVCGDVVDTWLKTSGWIVPATVIPFCLLLVHRHPEPVDDCPCFEDAIAFMSVVMGEFLTRWYMARNGFNDQFFVHRMPGQLWGTVPEMWAWWSIATAKMVIGILAIFAWRIFVKFLLHRILPPTFRFLAQLFTLPHRRFYTPATDYTNVPPAKGLHPIPSVLDLPGMLELDADSVSTARKNAAAASWNRQIKLRGAGRMNGRVGSEKPVVPVDYLPLTGKEGLGIGFDSEMGDNKGSESVKHYDADVLTKVFVYCGIGAIASGGMPVVFELIGWGL